MPPLRLPGSSVGPFPDAVLHPARPAVALPDPAWPAAASLRLSVPSPRWPRPRATCSPPRPPSPALPAHNSPSRPSPRHGQPENANPYTSDTTLAAAEWSPPQSAAGSCARAPRSGDSIDPRTPDTPGALGHLSSAPTRPVPPALIPAFAEKSPPLSGPWFDRWPRYPGSSRPAGVPARPQRPWQAP
jgi:hypothetical protein